MRVTRSTRRALLVVGVTTGLLAGAAVGIGLWQHHERQRLASVVGRFEAELERRQSGRPAAAAISDEENAGPVLLAAAEDIPKTCSRACAEVHALLDRPVGSWSEAEREWSGTPLATCAPSLEALHVAADRLYVAFPPVGVGEDGTGTAHWQELGPTMLRAARLLELDARRAAESGEPERLAADWNALAKISAGLAREDTLLHGLFATAVHGLELRLVHGLVESGRVPAERVAEIRRHFESLAAHGDLVSRSLPVDALKLRPDDQKDLNAPWEVAGLANDLVCSYGLFLGHRDTTWMELEQRLESPPEECVGSVYGKILMPNLRDAYGKFRTVDAARQLAIAALAVYERGAEAPSPRMRDEIPFADQPNRYTGETVRIDTTVEGTLILTYPKAEERAHAAYPDPAAQPPFVYRLPLPAS